MAGTDAANKQTQDSGAPVFYSQASDSGIVDVLAGVVSAGGPSCSQVSMRAACGEGRRTD